MTKYKIRDAILRKYKEFGIISDNLLHESLMDVLKDGKIEITGYDFSIYSSINRMQSIKSDGLIFGFVTHSSVELQALLIQLNNNDPVVTVNANNRLRRQFIRKFKEYLEWEEKRWDARLKSVHEIQHDFLEKTSEFLKNYDPRYGFDESSSFLFPKTLPIDEKALKNLTAITGLLLSIKGDQKVWIYLKPFFAPLSKTVICEDPDIETFLKLGKIIVTGNEDYHEDKSKAKSRVLNQLGFYHPGRLFPWEKGNTYMEDVYEWIINYIIFTVDTETKNKYIQQLAQGLSDSKDSEFIFELLIEDLSDKSKEEYKIKMGLLENRDYYC